jgi:2-(1,2-epoxy-1,2-dihydrophenyl)acetyl-CoA isomerase
MIKTSTYDGVVTIALDRPEALNALTRELAQAVLDALRNAIVDGARAVVLTGTGRAFSAGADLVAAAPAVVNGTAAGRIGRDMREATSPLIEAIGDSSVPVVCAVNGPCVGGAVGLALAADIVVAARSAYFLIPQVATLGIVPDLGATWQLPRLLGRARALGAQLLGERIPAQRAQDWGLIWKCVADESLADEAMSIACRLAGVSAASMRATRRLTDAAPGATLAGQLEQERRLQVELADSDFFRVAVERFMATSSPKTK